MGWGLTGICPGPGVVSAATGQVIFAPVIFFKLFFESRAARVCKTRSTCWSFSFLALALEIGRSVIGVICMTQSVARGPPIVMVTDGGCFVGGPPGVCRVHDGRLQGLSARPAQVSLSLHAHHVESAHPCACTLRSICSIRARALRRISCFCTRTLRKQHILTSLPPCLPPLAPSPLALQASANLPSLAWSLHPSVPSRASPLRRCLQALGAVRRANRRSSPCGHHDAVTHVIVPRLLVCTHPLDLLRNEGETDGGGLPYRTVHSSTRLHA